MTEIPRELGELSSLITLFLGDNDVHSLPPEIGLLYHLQSLDLTNNHLQVFPTVLANLKELRELYLSGNELRELSPEIGTLEALERLYVDHNHLRDLPKTMRNLRHLSDIDLSYNDWLPCKLADLPLPEWFLKPGSFAGAANFQY